MLNIEQLCLDYNIIYSDKVSSGFINVQCPFCDDRGTHLGININNAYATCFRCGYHPLLKTIMLLLSVNYNIAKDIIQKYSLIFTTVSKQESKINIPSQIVFPSDTQSLTSKAKKYLISRNYDPDKLVQTWGLLSTGHTGFYKHRILAPIYQRQQLVSYQCRDITGKHPQKYLACHQEEEIIPHQHCIYGINLASNRKCIVVEGITDVWRLGPGAVATFGILFTKQQARLIAMNFDKIFIMFDSEPQAQEKAEELGFLVGSAFNNPVEVINLPFLINEIDPGNLPQNIADDIMKEIGL